MSFVIHALPVSLLAEVRATRRDASGGAVERVVAEGDEPLRCCLRNARPGEALLLFNHKPPIDERSPYREAGAVFAHAEACEGPEAADRYPRARRGKRQVLRAYDRRGWIVDAEVHDGTDPEAAIARLFADERAVELHSHNVAYGCFMFVVARGDEVSAAERR